MIFKNATLYLENEVLENAWLKITGEKIVDFGVGDKFKEAIDLKDKMVVPGFIDQHIHGAKGFDTMDATIESLENIAIALSKEGVTSFLATTITQSEENICKALKNAASYIDQYNYKGAEVLGIHLEGPFVSKEYAGAHIPMFIQSPSVAQFKKYQKAAGNHIKIVTLAPEEDDAYQLITYLQENHVVASIGHSNAKYEEVEQAVKHGATNITHCYNAMRGIHHREVGVLGAAMLLEPLKAEIICDGIHVQKEAVRLLYHQKKEKGMILITDAMRAKGLKEGTYELGGQSIVVKENEARTEKGNLAGSVLFMEAGIKNIIDYTGCTLLEVVKMASENPAKQIGIYHRKGSIQQGKDADLVILDKHYHIHMSICRGQICYRKGGQGHENH
ncbi:N-acetylglucosamine-6-phosphate deacetylase [Clostridiaceae bacterium 35-E11]